MPAISVLALYAALALALALPLAREDAAPGPLLAFAGGGLAFLAVVSGHIALLAFLRGRRLVRALSAREGEVLRLRRELASLELLRQQEMAVSEEQERRGRQRLEGLSEREVLALLREALSEDRMALVVQPIVTLPQRKLRYFECYTRLRDAQGAELPAEDFIALAVREGLVTAVDNVLLLRALQLCRNALRLKRDVGFFCNLSAATLADGDFFRDAVDYLAELPELSESLILEFAEADLGRLSTASEELERLRELGFRFSLDHLRDLELDPRILARRGFRFVKLEAAAAERLIAEKGSEALSRLMRRHADCGIEMILERIESEASLKELLDYGFPLGQGYLLGQPRSPRLTF